MASGTKVKKHECSCGRSFRHAISLKRHQNVTGCDAANLDEVQVVEHRPELRETPVEEKNEDLTIVVTPELVAEWQAQTGFQRRQESVIDSIPGTSTAPKTDWVAVARTTRAFFLFCSELKTGALRSARSALVVVGRSAFFFGVLFLAGWFLVTGVSASDSPSVNQAVRDQLAAQTLVEDFLNNARLNQYERASRFLAPSARRSVTAGQLQIMFNSLPLDQYPSSVRSEISDDGQTARVILTRGGADEVYTLVMSSSGWGLTSVAVSGS